MKLYKIVMRIVGPIYPTAKHEVDAERLENLDALIDLVASLLGDIRGIAGFRSEQAESVMQLGQKAYAFLRDIGIEE